MLTMKIKYQESNIEVVELVEKVEYIPPHSRKEDHPAPGLLVEYGNGRASHLCLTPLGDTDYRDVFIMNDKGSTVARYTL